jgi:hypothetical protein
MVKGKGTGASRLIEALVESPIPNSKIAITAATVTYRHLAGMSVETALTSTEIETRAHIRRMQGTMVIFTAM